MGLIIYLKGLSLIIGVFIWIVGFNYFFEKYTGKKDNDLFAYLFGPFVIPFGLILLFFTPYLIAVELF